MKESAETISRSWFFRISAAARFQPKSLGLVPGRSHIEIPGFVRAQVNTATNRLERPKMNGPQAVLGSQRVRLNGGLEIRRRTRFRSWRLRAGAGARSVVQR